MIIEFYDITSLIKWILLTQKLLNLPSSLYWLSNKGLADLNIE